MTPAQCVGHGASLLVLAVSADVIGLVLLFAGIFADARLRGLFYGDFLIYTGAVLVFVSLVFWLMWYVGNIPAPEEARAWEGDGGVVERLARSISRKMSHKPRRFREEPPQQQQQQQQGRVQAAEDGGRSPTPHKASRVTWGKNSAYNNQGYHDEEEDKAAREEQVEEGEQGPHGGEGEGEGPRI